MTNLSEMNIYENICTTVSEARKKVYLTVSSSEGKAELTVELSKPALAFKKLNEKRLKYFNCQNSADHILFLVTDVGWELHVIEMKRTVTPSKWLLIKEQFKGAMLNGICLAAFLGIKIIKINLYTAFRNNEVNGIGCIAI